MAMMVGNNRAVFLDTNILLRWNIAEAPLHNETRLALSRLVKAEYSLWISVQVLREFAAVATRPNMFPITLSERAVSERIQELLKHFNVIEETLSVHRKLLELMQFYAMGGKQIHDANIVASMLTQDIPLLLTLNTTDFVRFQDKISLLSLEDALKAP